MRFIDAMNVVVRKIFTKTTGYYFYVDFSKQQSYSDMRLYPVLVDLRRMVKKNEI